MSVALLDEVGRACPLPVIALGRALRTLPPGSEVVLRADDPVVATDVPAWCRMTGAQLLHSEQDASGIFTIRVRLPRAQAPPPG